MLVRPGCPSIRSWLRGRGRETAQGGNGVSWAAQAWWPSRSSPGAVEPLPTGHPREAAGPGRSGGSGTLPFEHRDSDLPQITAVQQVMAGSARFLSGSDLTHRPNGVAFELRARQLALGATLLRVCSKCLLERFMGANCS